MPPTSPVLSLYSSNLKDPPKEGLIVRAWGIMQAMPASDEMLTRDAGHIAQSAATAGHYDFLCNHFIPRAKALSDRTWLAVMLLSMLAPNDDKDKTSCVLRDMLKKVDEAIDLGEAMTHPLQKDGAGNGLTIWDFLLATPAHSFAWIQEKLPLLASFVERVDGAILDRPHPLFPDKACKDVWLWAWCTKPMLLANQVHLMFLLDKGADPDIALNINGKPISAGSLVLLHRAQEDEDSPAACPSHICPDIHSSVLGPHSFASLSLWALVFHLEAPRGGACSLQEAHVALKTMSEWGMDAGALQVDDPLGTPLLVAYRQYARREKGWEDERLEGLWNGLLALGFSLGPQDGEGPNFLTLLAEEGLRASLPSHTTLFLRQTPALERCVFEGSIRALTESDHFGRDILGHPLMKKALSENESPQRIDQGRPEEGESPHWLLHHHVLAFLDTIGEEKKTRLLKGAMEDQAANPSPSVDTPGTHTCMVDGSLTAAENKAIEELEYSQKPKTLIYREDDARRFWNWAQTRDQEQRHLEDWKNLIFRQQPEQTPSMPRAARHLSLAQDALAALPGLRSAFPHFEEITDLIERHLLLQMRGDGVFSLPPLLMVGPPGTGKTFFFEELSRAVDTHYSILNMEGVTAGFSISGLDNGWANASPGHVFETLMAPGSTANPIILLDELDKSNNLSQYPASQALLPLLERHTAQRFTDRAIPMPLDASHICWVATANDIERIEAPLRSRLVVIHVPNPDYPARQAMAAHIYQSLRNKNSWGRFFDPELTSKALHTLAGPPGAARDLRKNLMEAFGRAAADGRTLLLPEDIPVPRGPAHQAPWDLPLPEVGQSA